MVEALAAGVLRVLKDPKPSDDIKLDLRIMDKARKCIDAIFLDSKPWHV